MKGKTAIVTGGGNGIGRATCKLLAKRGVSVLVSDIDAESGEKVVQEIEADGGEASFKKCDVSSQEQVEEMVEFTIDTYGELDFAVNNAGVEGKREDVVNCSAENWNFVVDINLTGVWHCMKYEIPAMLESGGGSIVNNASIAGLVGFDHLPAYVASKHGVVGLTKAAALDYSDQGIRVNSICPGVIETEMVARAFEETPEVRDAIVESKPMARLGQPEEMAEVIAWLCSDSSSFVTGQALAADGGYVAR